MIKQYLINWLYGLDRLLNVALGGSSKLFVSTSILYHKDSNRLCKIAYNILNWIEPQHCQKAAKTDLDPDHRKGEVWGIK